MGCTGLIVGTIRWVFSFPDDLPGFFKEVTTCHVDPHHMPLTFILSAVSIAGGASLGPEQALVSVCILVSTRLLPYTLYSNTCNLFVQGNVGGGLTTYLAEYFKFGAENSKLLVLTGMAAAMGGVFPTPVLGVLMIHELGSPPRFDLFNCINKIYLSNVRAVICVISTDLLWSPHY